MAEPIIAKARKPTPTAVLACESLSFTLSSRDETGTTAVSTCTSNPVAPTQHSIRADAPISIIPSRRRSTAGVNRTRCSGSDLSSYHTASHDIPSTLNVMENFKMDSSLSSQRERTVVVQQSTIKKQVIATGTRPEPSPATPKRSNSKQRFSSPSRNRSRTEGSLGRVSEERPCETGRGEPISSRIPSRRRTESACNRRTDSNITRDASVKESEPPSAPRASCAGSSAVGPFSPLSSMRLTDLERPSGKGLSLNLLNTTNNRRTRVPHKIVNLSLCKYSLLRVIAEENGFKIQETEDDLEKNIFNIVWSDTVLPLTKLVRLGNWQRTNHFPSMHLLCRKGHLGITLGRIRKVLPSHYLFYPRTWSLRSERHQFNRFFMALRSRKLTKFFIMKPNSGCQGRGIVITRDPLNAVEDTDNYIVQEYITRPLLLEERKFDLRVYVLVTSIRAPSIFMFNDGLVRLCAEVYDRPSDSNVKNTCKHLTNYAVNKHSPEYVFNEDAANGGIGNKRNFKFFNEWLRESGKCVETFWDRVAHVVCKTILVAQPQIANVYNSCFPRQNCGYTCFEVLGFDILVDHKMKPWLMEVNHTPSFATDTPLDYEIKHALISEVWDILDIRATDRRRDVRKERDEFIQRMLRQANSTSTPSTAKGRSVSCNESAATASMCSMPTQVGGPSSSGPALGGSAQEPMTEMEKMIEERRASEDSRLRNFRRIYPSKNVEWQALYDCIVSQARALCSVPFTQPLDERQRRTDSISHASNVPLSITTAERSARTNTTESVGDNTSHASALHLRMAQRLKQREDVSPGNRKLRQTPRTSPVPLSATRKQNGAQQPYAPLLRPPPPPPSSIEQQRISFTQLQERRPLLPDHAPLPEGAHTGRSPAVVRTAVPRVPTDRAASTVRGVSVEDSSMMGRANMVTARILMSEEGKPLRVAPSPPMSPSVERLEALRNLQEQLDKEAECENSPSQDSDREGSFVLEE
ncbi:putative Tubulin tyrosine ligase family [Trypanosoma vivax]|nr:putative tubulin-tyrsoine ligase-like protein [Trypanosoma vivax]KAH8609474.1 putative Tubulin tyrosine ligase family [Trypanosoma vivax]